MIVRSELDKLEIPSSIIGLGEIKLRNGITIDTREKLKYALERSGFELLDEQETRLIERIKSIVIERVHYSDEDWRNSFPEYLSRRLRKDYSFLANLFYEVKNITIQNYFVKHKIERAKELLVYYKLNLTEVALQLNYRNIIHMSNQFRDVTGFSPCHFQEIKDLRSATQQALRMMEV